MVKRTIDDTTKTKTDVVGGGGDIIGSGARGGGDGLDIGGCFGGGGCSWL